MRPGGSNNGALAVWEWEPGLVRAHYRTNMTAADEFSKQFLVELVNGEPTIEAEKLARWCIERFVVRIEYRQDKDQPFEDSAFSWSLLEKMTGALAGPWAPILAHELAAKVVMKTAENLDALKKTSPTP